MATDAWSASSVPLESARVAWWPKRRRLREGLGVEVFSAFCESHAAEVPFRAIAALLRTAFGINELDAESARNRIRDRVAGVDPEDLLLLDDLLGIRDPRA